MLEDIVCNVTEENERQKIEIHAERKEMRKAVARITCANERDRHAEKKEIRETVATKT